MSKLRRNARSVPPARVFIGIGANVPPRMDYLRCALFLLRRLSHSRVIKLSPVYETSPIGPKQADFLNAVVEITTELNPAQLLKALKKTERELGRRPGPRWGPREIDLDILIYGTIRLQTKQLTVPHPGLNVRRFALKPLLDAAPRLRHPVSGELFRTIYRRLTGSGQRIRLYRRSWK